MGKERMEITEEDIETLFPMNENGQWEVMKHPKAMRTTTDERIDRLISRLPKRGLQGDQESPMDTSKDSMGMRGLRNNYTNQSRTSTLTPRKFH